MSTIHIGAIAVDALVDGVLTFPLDRMFPAPQAALFAPFGGVSSEGLLESPMTTYVIRAAGRLILVDTGIGPDISPLARFGYTGSAGRLPAALAAGGIAPESVDDVVFTHLHTDHIGWNTVSAGDAFVPMFPKARYVVARADWENRRRRRRQRRPLPRSSGGSRPAHPRRGRL